MKKFIKKHTVHCKRILSILCVLTVLAGGIISPISTDVFAEAENICCERNLEITPNNVGSDEATVTLNGIMPKNATAQAIDVTESFDTLSKTGNAEKDILAAYDITIMNGKQEYQPQEGKPIYVEIANSEINKNNVSELLHIKDDGTQEYVTDFTVEDGKISFYAKGFSVYAIVTSIPSPYSVTSIDQFTQSPRASDGIVLYYVTDTNKYFTNTVNGNGALNETTNVNSAAMWYFEKEGDYHKVYTYLNGEKHYICRDTQHSKPDVAIKLDPNAADSFNISDSSGENAFYFMNSDGGEQYLQHSNGGSGIRYYKGNDNKTNSRIKAYFNPTVPLEADYCHLDGETYGLMNYTGGGTVGNALMAEGGQNYCKLTSLIIREEDTGTKKLYVAQNTDISFWTFELQSGNQYKLYSDVNGTKKYLKLGTNSLTVVDSEADASLIDVMPNDDNQIQLTTNGYSVAFQNNGFSTAANSNSANQWLNIVELSAISLEDYITYSAKKVSVSDPEVTNGASVIVYTRIWDDEKKAYDFYAVNSDGSLYSCYERGDNIMWIDKKINTLLWEFTEYYNEDGTPSYYYELYNPYSQKYIAPNIETEQTVADNKIGINMPGRRDDEYHTTIVAWDDACYSYAGIYADIEHGKILAKKRKKASTFYFAIVDTTTPTLTKVDTLDNDEYGITMKMIDFPKQASNDAYDKPTSLQNYYLGDGKWDRRRATLGLLSTNLNDNDYPTMVNTGKNLAELFDLTPGTYKPDGKTSITITNDQTLKTVNHLFIESIYNSSGYFEFDSCQNYATLLKEDGVTRDTNFTVYKELGTTNGDTKTTLQHGQFLPYNTIRAGEYSTKSPENLYGALANADTGYTDVAKLDDTDPRKYEKLHLTQGTTNYYNGMELSAGFIQPPNGKDAWGHDIIFEFTGDDDFWLYVDGELVIDLGGIHSALEGKVNFSTGEVHLGGRGTLPDQNKEEFEDTTLRELFKTNYENRINPKTGALPTESEVNAYLDGIFIEKNGHYVFKDYSSHKMRIFYMERGEGASNLYMRFNLNHITPGHVMLTKELTGVETDDFDFVEYPYQIFYRLIKNGPEQLLTSDDDEINVTYQNSTQQVKYKASYTPPGSTETFASVYLLQPGKSAEIHFPSDAVEYRVVECGINAEVYDIVHANDERIYGEYIKNGGDYTDRKQYNSGWLEVKQRPAMVFKNNVVENALRTLSFQKRLVDENGEELTAEEDDTTFNFRLWLTNGVEDTLELANMYKYYVKSPEGKLCRWDVETQKFVPTNKTSHSALSEAEDEQLSFETSINGSISKIPAGYTVEVPNLPVGMKFKVEERSNEIPLGYSFSEYQRDENTYRVENGDDENTGRVVRLQSPHMTVENKRGWGLQATKIWSDKDFVTAHGDIYTAVYAGNVLVDGSVKRIRHPDTTVSYFFEHLQESTTLADYLIYEVKLTNPVVNEDGVVTHYDALERADNSIEVEVTPSTPKTPEYIIEYDQGTISGANDHIKKKNITNTRRGGLKINLYDMASRNNEQKIPLANGVFVLKQGNTVLGTFTSDAYGQVTIVYNFEKDTDYTLTQTSPPDKYIPVPNTMTFRVGGYDDEEGFLIVDTQTTTIGGNDAVWQEIKPSTAGSAIAAVINVYNKPYKFGAIKIESGETSTPIQGAVFALYRSVSGTDGETKDTVPMDGYGEIVSGSDGVLSGIDNRLSPGKYYLEETSTPFGYEELEEDIVFTISDKGEVTIISSPQNTTLSVTENETDSSISYVIRIPNTKIPDDSNKLTLSHTVNADNVNVGLKLETFGVANLDVFRVKLRTMDMKAGTNNDVKIPLELSFRRKSPNNTYINRYPVLQRIYTQKTPLTSVTNISQKLQLRKEGWSPSDTDVNNAASPQSSFRNINGYYTWKDTSKQLDIDGEPLYPVVKSSSGQGVGVPSDGIVSLLYDQTAIFRNQFPNTPKAENRTPRISFELQSNLYKFKATDVNENYNSSTGILKTDSSRTYSQYYETSFTMVGGTYTSDSGNAGTTGSGKFLVTSNNIALDYVHTIKTGSVTISKKLDGNISDKNTDGTKKAYTFIISYRNLFGCRIGSSIDSDPWTYAERLHGTLSGKDENNQPYTNANNSLDVAEGGRFTLVEGSSVTFTGIPVGTILRVEELSEFIGTGKAKIESDVSEVVFSGVIGNGNLSSQQNLNNKTDLVRNTSEVTEDSQTRHLTTVHTDTYQMTDDAKWSYEVHNTYSAVPVLYRYIDRHIVSGQPTDLRDNYTYFTKNVSIGYDDINANGTIKGAAKTKVSDYAPNIINVLCSYDITYDADTDTDGVYYENQNTFYRNTVKDPTTLTDVNTYSQFKLRNIDTELNNILDAMYGTGEQSENNSTVDEAAYNNLKDDCLSVKTETASGYAKDDIIGLKDSLGSIINTVITINTVGEKKPTKAQVRTALKDAFYYKDGVFYIIMATYANTLRLYDVNVQLVVPNALNTQTKTLTETKTVTVNSVSHKTGDYVHIKYKVPFNGLTNLSNTEHADGTLNINLINALGLSEACKELYHITTSDNRELYFAYWERIVSYHDGDITQTVATPVSTNFNYHYRVNDHVTIRAVYQEAKKAGSESTDNRKRYEAGKTFEQEEDFVPFDTDNNRTIERLYTPVQKRTRVIFWSDENGVRKYMDNQGEYTIPAEKVNGFTNYNDRFYIEAYNAKYGTGAVDIKIQIEDWENAQASDTGSHLTVSGTTTASSFQDETELYQVSYMVPNEQEQVGYAASATDRTYNSYSVQTANGVQERTRVDIIFGGIGSVDSDVHIEQVGYVLFQSPKNDKAKYGNAANFRNAISEGSLRSKLKEASDGVTENSISCVKNEIFNGYNVRINMTKVTMHTGSNEQYANTGGIVLTNKNRVNIVFDMPNNENTRKSFYTCYTVMKIKNGNNEYYRISQTPATFNLLDADAVTENEYKKSYAVNVENAAADDNAYLSSNYTTVVEGRRLLLTPHFLEEIEDGECYTGEIYRVEIGKAKMSAEQIQRLNEGKDVEVVFDPLVYLNDPLSENTFTVKVYVNKIEKSSS